MSIDDVTTQLRGQLQEAFGVDGATYLMDRPPGGWNDLVTNESLRLELRAISAELRAEMHQGFRDQTWRLMTALISVMAFFIAVIAALIKL